METLRNILVPLDGSKSSLKGLKFAITIANVTKARITGLNVVRYSLGFNFPVSSEIKKHHRQNSEQIIEDAKKISKKTNSNFVGKIIQGESIGKEIVKFAHTKKMDLIIIGSKGPDPRHEIFLGSVANFVLHKSKVPITIVR